MRDITSRTVTAYRWVARPIADDHASGVSVAAFAFFIFLASLFLLGTPSVWATHLQLEIAAENGPVFWVDEIVSLSFTTSNTSTLGGGPFPSPDTKLVVSLPPGLIPESAATFKIDGNGDTIPVDNIRVIYDMNVDEVRSDMGTVPDGEEVRIDMGARATQAGNFSVSASVTGALWNPDPSSAVGVYSFQVINPPMDFGDAPDPYPTLLENDGARHIIKDDGTSLGVPPDSEDDGQPHQDALGDDMAGDNDEASVEFWPPLLSGTTHVFVTNGTTTVGEAEGGYVNAWIDFNMDGDWADPGEQILTDEWLDHNTGKNLEFTVPPVTPEQKSGRTFARFRLSSQHSLSYTGVAPDGEVEDMTVTAYMEEKISLSPSTASNPVGTEHTVTASVYELHPNDRKVPLRGREVMFDILGPNYEVEPHTAITDENGNATFTYRGNKVGTDQIEAQYTDRWKYIHQVNVEKAWVLAPNPDISVNELLVEFDDTIVGIPSDKKITVSNPGDARLNITEIEITGDDSSDFSVLGTGDDPNDLGPSDTLILESGHESSIFLRFVPVDEGDKSTTLILITDVPGKDLVEIELRGTAIQGALTIDMIIPTDPDSVGFPSPVGSERQVGATLKDASDKPVAGHVLTITVVDGPNKGTTGTGLTDETGRAFFKYKGAGPGTDKIVATFVDRWGVTQTSEQSVIEWAEYDFGDAPAPYPTLLEDNGARHVISEVYMGISVDAEADGQPGVDADGDDRNSDDEDGISGMYSMVPGAPVAVTLAFSTPGYLSAWVDFNRDGKWDHAHYEEGGYVVPSEQICPSVWYQAGTQRLHFTVPRNATPGGTFARFRFSTTDELLPNGPAEDGEVEDYWYVISQPREYITTNLELQWPGGWKLGTEREVLAYVWDTNGVKILGRVVTFTIVDGPHKGMTGTDATGSNGYAKFAYTGTKPGTDVILASFVDSEGETRTTIPFEIKWASATLPDKGSGEKPVVGVIKYNSSGAKGVLHKVGSKDTIIIGYSDPHEDGDASDTGGTPVGTMGTIISDADFPLVPPGFQGPPGTREVHTELRELSMSNADGVAVRAGTDLGLPMNPGEVESLSGGSGDPDLDFPAESFFDVFVEIDLPETTEHPAVTVYNSDPLLLINNNVIALPSRMIYVTGNDSAIPLYYRNNHPDGDWNAGDLFGWLTTAAIGVDFDPDDPDDAREFEDEVLKLSDLTIPAPVVLDIPDQSIEPPDEFASIKLDDYVSDPDNEDSEMVWAFDGNTKLKVSIKERVATVTLSDPAWAGSETVTFTVKDPGGLSGSKSVTFTVTQPPASVDPDGKALGTWGTLRRTVLYQNYPNPFNPDTWIPYQLAEGTDAVIRIHDASGKTIRTLDLGHELAGFYATKDKAAYWDGRNESGESVASGIYFYSITAGDYTATRKMTVRR